MYRSEKFGVGIERSEVTDGQDRSGSGITVVHCATLHAQNVCTGIC